MSAGTLRSAVKVDVIKTPGEAPNVNVFLHRRTKQFSATFMKREFTDATYDGLVAKVSEHFSTDPIEWRPIVAVSWTTGLSEDEGVNEERLPDVAPEGQKVLTSVSRNIGVTIMRLHLGRRDELTYTCPWQWYEREGDKHLLATLQGQKAMESKSRVTRVPVPQLPHYAVSNEGSKKREVFLPYDEKLWARLRASISGADPLGATVGYLSTFKIPGLK